MSGALPLVRHLDRVERGLRDLIADRGAHHSRLYRHDHAEDAFDPAVVVNDPEGYPDVPAHYLDAAGVHEELWTAKCIDIPCLHSNFPVSLGREAARRAGDKHTSELNQLESESFAAPQSYGVSFWELSGTLTLSPRASFHFPRENHRSNSNDKNDQPDCVCVDHGRRVM